MSSSIAIAKQQWRAVILSKRRVMTSERKVAAATMITATLRARLRQRQPATIAAYAPFGSEPGGLALVETLASEAETVLLPVVTNAQQLQWMRYEPALGLRAAGRMWEPISAEPEPVSLDAAELIVAPALAVDTTGTRLGRGGGYYDRALAAIDKPVVALLHDGEFITESLPYDRHDVRVDAVITPTLGWHEISLAVGTPQC